MEQNLLVGNSVGFVVMQDKESIDIDEPFDFEMCEILLENKTPDF
jgi:CMP-N-acetylneuraminic acid synthetase